MLISSSRSFLFIHIQKTGGSSLHAALHAHFPDLRSFLGTHDTALQALDRLGEAEYGRYYKAAFVRNPWARLVSWYMMIVQVSQHLSWWERLRRRRYVRLWQYVHANSGSFEEFVRNCTAEIADVDGTKSFVRNQVDYLTDRSGTSIVDFVGRYETLEADAQRLFAELALPPPAIPHVNASRHDHYARYYTDDLADLVRTRFHRDIEAFGYEFERLQPLVT